MSHDQYLLSVDNVTKLYSVGGWLSRAQIAAVASVSLRISAKEPEILTLVGESGSGKTTLGRMILRLVPPTTGRILFKGRDISTIRTRDEQREFMQNVQPIFQNPFETFNPLKKLERYLFETAGNFNSRGEGSIEDRIDDALNLVGLSMQEIRGRYPHELSGGQLQRVSIARALLASPSLLVADEPVSMIDASLRISVVNLFKELKERHNVTIIYITHDLATAYYISDRIAVMQRGHIVEIGPVSKVLVEPLHPYTKLLRESVLEPDDEGILDKEITLSTIETKEFARAGCKFAGRCSSRLPICDTNEPPLLDIDGREVKCWLYRDQPKANAV